MKTQLLIAALSTVMVAGVANVTFADESRDLARAAAAVNVMGEAKAGQDRVCARMAAEVGVDVKTIEQRKAQTGMACGDLMAASAVAKTSGRAFADVAADFKSGKTWAQIATSSKVKLGAVAKSCQHVETAALRETTDVRVREKCEMARAMACLNATDQKAAGMVCSRIAGETGVAIDVLAKARTENHLAFADLLVAAEACHGSVDAFAKATAEIKAGKTCDELAANAGVKVSAVVKSANRVDAMVEHDQREMEKRQARECHDLDKRIASINTAAHKGEARVCARISEETGIAVKTLEQEKASASVGFGELLVAHEVAGACGKSFATIVAELNTGKGWGEIASDNNLRVGRLLTVASRVDADVGHHQTPNQNVGVVAQADGSLTLARGTSGTTANATAGSANSGAVNVSGVNASGVNVNAATDIGASTSLKTPVLNVVPHR